MATSLRRFLSLQVSLAIALPFTLVLLLAWFWVAPQLKSESELRQRQLATALSLQIESHLETAATIVRATATLTRPELNDHNIQEHFDALLNATDTLNSLYRIEADGLVSMVTVRSGGQTHRTDLMNINLSGNPLFKRLQDTGSPLWSKTFLSLINAQLSVAYGVNSKGTVYLGEINLTHLSEFLAQISSESDNLLLVLDQNWQIIADNSNTFTARQMNIGNIPLIADGFKDGLLSTDNLTFAGQSMTGSIAPIKGIDWHVLVARSNTAMYENVRKITFFSLGGVLAAFACGLLVAYYQARKLSSRFDALTAHARRITHGKIQQDWPTSTIREFNELSENLQNMAGRLQQSGQTLELYGYALNNAQDSLFIISEDAHFKFVNDAACDKLGYSREQLLALRVFDVDPNFSVTGWPEHWQQLRHDSNLRIESSHCSSTGQLIPMEINLKMFQFDGIEYLVSLARDLTERKKFEEERLAMERQLLHTQKLESLGVLAGGIAHDFNNLLTAIIGNAEIGRRRLKPESPAMSNLEGIEQAAQRAADLARQMLSYSGRGKFIVEPLDLNVLLEEMLHMLEVSISKKAILRFNLHRPLPAVEADATQIRQILMNLIINASEAIGDKSGVIATTTGCMDCDESYLQQVWLEDNLKPGLYVYLEVADTGCGMDKETLSKLFDPFFTTKFTGRGLGMAAVLGIVRGHKGAIKVYSELGKGTTFKILLPACNRPAELFNNAKQNGQNWQGTGKVLLVDDEESVRAIGVDMLQELGFETLTATNGWEALEKFRHHPDIRFVLLDLIMPKMDGEQCYRELRQLDPQVKVVLCSGYSEQEVTQKFIGKGLAGFIQKPYKLSVLQEILQKIV